MRFWLYPNPTSAEARALADTLAQRLGDQLAEKPEDANVVIVLGGDGTMLRAVRALNTVNKPFWVVNCGHLGYLSDCGREEALDGLERILQSDFHLEYRAQIGGTLMTGRRVTALNELLFHRGACMHTLQIDVHVNGSLAQHYRGDGLIVCTPSGSTAYNLSAGGPVLTPDSGCFSLTPICAHTPGTAPIVVPDRDTYLVSITDTGRDSADVLADGIPLGSLNEPLSIRRHGQTLRLLRRKDM